VTLHPGDARVVVDVQNDFRVTIAPGLRALVATLGAR
jgi:hypothetical protein